VYLTKHEERILEGEEGEAKRIALKTIVKVGEVLGATRLVKLKRAHISGISYKNIGDEGLEFIRKLVELNANVACRTTTNPSAIPVNTECLPVSEDFERRQKEIHSYLSTMGAELTLSCIPYEYSPPSLGEQIGWGESNAVLYANTILGARTNREAAPLTILEAIVARAPLIGLRTDEGRLPSCVVVVDKKLESEMKNNKIAPSIVGYTIGRVVKNGVPFIKCKVYGYIKEFLAGIGASSSIGMVHLDGISPEAEKATRHLRNLEKITVDYKEVRECEELITMNFEEADAYLLGCPHLSPSELKSILMYSTSTHRDISVILTTSAWVYQKFKQLIDKLRKRGFIVLPGTCLVVAPLENLDIKRIITDSAKAAYYLSSQGLEVSIVPREVILK